MAKLALLGLVTDSLAHKKAAASGSAAGAWIAVFLLAIVDFTWRYYSGLTFTFDWLKIICVFGVIGLINIFYGILGRSTRLASMANYAGLWIAFTITGAMFTYLTAHLRLPLVDSKLATFDTWLAFDWITWFSFVAAHPALSFFLGLAYSSLILQIIASILFFCHIGRPDRNLELWWMALISLLITSVISGIFPAAGAGIRFGAWAIKYASYLPHFLALRDGSLQTIALADMQGIITFPSYHTVLALLVTYAYRDQKYLLALVMALNTLMLFSIPPYGNHYIADMIAGACVAAASIAVLRTTRPKRRANELVSHAAAA